MRERLTLLLLYTSAQSSSGPEPPSPSGEAETEVGDSCDHVRKELRGSAVRVINILPGWVDTEGLSLAFQDEKQAEVMAEGNECAVSALPLPGLRGPKRW